MNGPRDANSPRVGQAFETRGNIHSVSEDVVVLDDNVADVDADTEHDTLLLGHIGVALGHRVLDFDRALDGFDRAGELGQKTVAHQLDDAPMVLADFGVN